MTLKTIKALFEGGRGEGRTYANEDRLDLVTPLGAYPQTVTAYEQNFDALSTWAGETVTALNDNFKELASAGGGSGMPTFAVAEYDDIMMRFNIVVYGGADLALVANWPTAPMNSAGYSRVVAVPIYLDTHGMSMEAGSGYGFIVVANPKTGTRTTVGRISNMLVNGARATDVYYGAGTCCLAHIKTEGSLVVSIALTSFLL